MARKSKANGLSDVLSRLKDKFPGSVAPLSDTKDSRSIEKFSSGSLNLDSALNGGFPKGKLIEVFGPPGGGKSTMALQATASVQANGGKVLWMDAENALDIEYATRLNVNVDELILCQPSSGEEGWEIAEELLMTGEVQLAVIDSVPCMTPMAENELAFGESRMGLFAKLTTQSCKRLITACAKTNSSVILINQIRANLSGFGANTDTPGGYGLKFLCSTRVEVRRVGGLKVGENEIGSRCQAKVLKSRTSKPYCKVEFDLVFGEGIDNLSEVLDFALDKGYISKAGAWYSHGEEKIGQGREAAKRWLSDNPEVVEIYIKEMSKNEKSSSDLDGCEGDAPGEPMGGDDATETETEI